MPVKIKEKEYPTIYMVLGGNGTSGNQILNTALA
jgi:hypothetical protein